MACADCRSNVTRIAMLPWSIRPGQLAIASYRAARQKKSVSALFIDRPIDQIDRQHRVSLVCHASQTLMGEWMECIPCLVPPRQASYGA
ncbi:unnamed protein product [Tuber melanosporum]|uniref:(Perigord truffle) hypothetical protein n=1 Tax=Tuber melanosporum (strain Mel28) TaxID=656061 RepID=D5GLW9_TUBMM|nr:uncharacterized protein GSTUM_00010451001 [Tuber melanosporum]CAZ85536.1 unnamed protein product [Tuber melanosporum]